MDFSAGEIIAIDKPYRWTSFGVVARDIGQALRSGAYLTGLRRTRIGDYRVEDCLQLDQLPAWLDSIEITDTQN